MKRYLLYSLLAASLLSTIVVAFNFWADPYAIYRFPSADADRISRVNQIFHMRLSKPWQVASLKPTALIIGSSRAASIRARHPLWDDYQAYNFSMPGVTLYEMQRLIQHAHAQRGLQKLVISLEHETFVTDDYQTGIGFTEARLAGAVPATSQPEFLAQVTRDLRDTLFTGSTLTRSLQATLAPPQQSHRYWPDGSWENQSRIWLGEPGYVFVGGMMVKRTEQPSSGLNDNLAIFASILDFCHRHGIDTRLYFSPEHLFLTELREQLGATSGWRQFHYELLALNENIAGKHKRQAFPVWGFNQLDGVVNEPLHKGVANLDVWFRDGIHFDHRLGALLMDQIWGSGGDGLQVDTQTIASYFNQVEGLRKEFVHNQPELVTRYQQKILGKTTQPKAQQPLAMLAPMR